MWVEKVRKFYNKSMKSWLQDNHIEMYSTHKEGKFVAETNIQIYHFKIRYVYTDILDDIVNEYNNTYHTIIKRKPIYVMSSTYADFGV